MSQASMETIDVLESDRLSSEFTEVSPGVIMCWFVGTSYSKCTIQRPVVCLNQFP